MKHRMKLRLLLLLLFVITASLTSWAQNSVNPSFTIKGILLDSLTQQGEPYATIKITKKNAPGKAVKMAVTGANGQFQEKLNVAAGDYVIAISSIGKSPIVKEFSLKPSVKVVDLGTMLSVEATNELKGVEVVAQKPLVKVDVDKIEYNIEDDPDSKSNSVLEMLRKVPLVTVDGEDNIQVNGSSSFKVHVNGKPNNMMSNNPKDVLKSMPANSIKHIEVITSPGAKYDAEGVGGILNIVTVGSGFEGYTATIRTNASNNGVGAGGYGMLKQGKLTVSANYNYNYNDRPRSYSDDYREDYESVEEKFLESRSSLKSKGNFQHGNLEASYEIDTLQLLTVAVGMYGSGNKNNSEGSTVMYGADRKNVAYCYRTDNHGEESWFSVNGNIDYQRTSKKNKERMLTLSYKINTQPQTNDSYGVYLDIFPEEEKDDIMKRFSLRNFRANGESNTMEHTLQVDYTTPIGKLHTIETGAKYIFRRNSSDDQVFEADGGSEDYLYSVDRSSNYRHLNHILAAYLGYSLKYKEFSFKPGIRYEQTIQQVKYIVGPGENFHSNFSDVVPSVAMGFKIGQTQNVRGSYSMRILRPGIWNLNPYFDNKKPMFISQGNPDLESEKSHSLDLAYSNFTSKFNINVALRHTFDNNGIEQFSTLITNPDGEEFDGNPEHTAPQGALYSTYANMGKSKNTGLSMYLNWNASSNTRIYMNGRGSYSDMRSEARELHNFGWTGSVHGGIQHTFPLKIRLSLNAGGSTPRIKLQGRGSSYNYYSLGLSRSFLKEERFSLNLYFNNMFEKYRSYSTRTEGVNFLSSSLSKYPSRYFGVSISYRIGELKASVKKAARSIENDDVKGGGEGGNSGDGGGGQ